MVGKPIEIVVVLHGGIQREVIRSPDGFSRILFLRVRDVVLFRHGGCGAGTVMMVVVVVVVLRWECEAGRGG